MILDLPRDPEVWFSSRTRHWRERNSIAHLPVICTAFDAGQRRGDTRFRAFSHTPALARPGPGRSPNAPRRQKESTLSGGPVRASQKHYSYFRATIGSTFMARRAGM